MSSVGRPPDPRVRLSVYVKEDVKERILAGIRKGVSAMNTAGKVIEQKFPKEKTNE